MSDPYDGLHSVDSVEEMKVLSLHWLDLALKDRSAAHD